LRGTRWVMAYEGDRTGCRVTAAARIEVGQRLTAGREGDLPIGAEIANTRISRQALTVTATDLGWHITMTNRNGGMVHPWAQPPELATPDVVLNWPLVAIRVPAEPGASRHWVLLEADNLPIIPGGPRATQTDITPTDRIKRPSGLPPAEQEALYTVFGAQLQWPPLDAVQPLLLKQAAKRVGITVSGLQDRLKSARARATKLGLGGRVGLADPTYLYLLVRAGYLAPPTSFPHRLVGW
jgi:hypothetical protein